MERVERDGKVAVLISSGWGAGWYTWNEQYPDMMFDPQIVQMVLDNSDEDDIISVAQTKWPSGYFGGAEGLSVRWVNSGTQFRITEYDGHESLEINDEIQWFVA